MNKSFAKEKIVLMMNETFQNNTPPTYQKKVYLLLFNMGIL